MAKIKKPESGVASNLYKNYDFNDHIWFQHKNSLLEMCNVCVNVDGIYYVKQPRTHVWAGFKKDTLAKIEVMNKWLGAKLPLSGEPITQDMIEEFFTGFETIQQQVGKKMISTRVAIGGCPNIHHQMVVPFADSFVEFDNRTYLNTWKDSMVIGDDKHSALGRLMLRLVYRSLCAGELIADDADVESQMLLQQVVDNKYLDLNFKFVMNWLAAIYQRPGINLQTNLWFIGGQGMGKGTLVEVMSRILGADYVGKLNQTEIEAGWSNHLKNKLLIEVNEFDSSGKMSGPAWNKWIKANCNEVRLMIRERNATACEVLNIANYIFATNDRLPIWIDSSDRRNQMIETTHDLAWREYAAQVQTNYVKRDPDAVASGFAWILGQVEVDWDFIKSAFVNDFKAEVLTQSEDHIIDWLMTDGEFERDVWIASSTLYDYYKSWRQAFSSRDAELSHRGWALKMNGLTWVQKRRTNKSAEYSVGTRSGAVAVDRSAIASDVGKITGTNIQVANYDRQVEDVEPVKLTSLQRLRANLKNSEG